MYTFINDTQQVQEMGNNGIATKKKKVITSGP